MKRPMQCGFRALWGRWGIMLALMLAVAACQPVAAATPMPVYDTGVDPEAWAVVPAGPCFSRSV